jgi:outer membrane protein OmpA-like peptidoglycan-associated protein
MRNLLGMVHRGRVRRSAAMRPNVTLGLILALCFGVMACSPVTPSTMNPEFSAPSPGPAVPLPKLRPKVDNSYNLPTSKDEVSIDLKPRLELHESVAADSDETSALLASVVLTLPTNRLALRQVDVNLAVKKRSDGTIAQTRDIAFSRDTREASLTVALAPLVNGTYDIDVHTRARIDVLDEDWTVMVDMKEATERIPMVIGTSEGQREQSKLFEFRFDNEAAVPIADDRKTLERTMGEIGTLLGAHPEATARVDCWTSSAGSEALNMALATRRCDWFKEKVWARLAHTTKEPLAAVPHSSNELAKEERSRDAKVQSRNRVVRLRVRWIQ